MRSCSGSSSTFCCSTALHQKPGRDEVTAFLDRPAHLWHFVFFFCHLSDLFCVFRQCKFASRDFAALLFFLFPPFSLSLFVFPCISVFFSAMLCFCPPPPPPLTYCPISVPVSLSIAVIGSTGSCCFHLSDDKRKDSRCEPCSASIPLPASFSSFLFISFLSPVRHQCLCNTGCIV